MKIEFTLNGTSVAVTIPEDVTLLSLLRDTLGLTGTKKACEIGQCGACSVIVDGKLVRSCRTMASDVIGCDVTTIEGVHGPDGGPNDLQQAFLEHGALQCGICTPGMVMAGEALLSRNPNPSRAQIRRAISGNLCRCTGYQQIIDAIETTAQRRRDAKEASHG